MFSNWSFILLKYFFSHTSFGSQNQIHIKVNIVIDNTKFKVTTQLTKNTVQKIYLSSEDKQGLVCKSSGVVYIKTSANSSEFITQVQLIPKA